MLNFWTFINSIYLLISFQYFVNMHSGWQALSEAHTFANRSSEKLVVRNKSRNWLNSERLQSSSWVTVSQNHPHIKKQAMKRSSNILIDLLSIRLQMKVIKICLLICLLLRWWEDNINMDLEETWCEDVDWFHLAEDGVQWALVSTVMSLQVP